MKHLSPESPWTRPNRARQVVTACLFALVIIPLLLFIALCIQGCASVPNEHKDAYALDIVERPTPVRHPNDKQTVRDNVQPAGLYHYRERHTTTAETPPTAKQRFGMIVGSGLGIGTLVVIALAVLCPGTLAAFALKFALKWRAAFKQTVQGIEAAKLAGEAGKVTDHLSRALDASTKKVVAEVRHQ